ncbi:hypothetical protein ACWEQL_17370 [Kitasatospora sp. NPDC004240]
MREWRRLRGTALDFNHCEGFDHARWWNPIEHFDASDETTERDRIRRIVGTEPPPEPGD